MELGKEKVGDSDAILEKMLAGSSIDIAAATALRSMRAICCGGAVREKVASALIYWLQSLNGSSIPLSIKDKLCSALDAMCASIVSSLVKDPGNPTSDERRTDLLSTVLAARERAGSISSSINMVKQALGESCRIVHQPPEPGVDARSLRGMHPWLAAQVVNAVTMAFPPSRVSVCEEAFILELCKNALRNSNPSDVVGRLDFFGRRQFIVACFRRLNALYDWIPTESTVILEEDSRQHADDFGDSTYVADEYVTLQQTYAWSDMALLCALSSTKVASIGDLVGVLCHELDYNQSFRMLFSDVALQRSQRGWSKTQLGDMANNLVSVLSTDGGNLQKRSEECPKTCEFAARSALVWILLAESGPDPMDVNEQLYSGFMPMLMRTDSGSWDFIALIVKEAKFIPGAGQLLRQIGLELLQSSAKREYIKYGYLGSRLLSAIVSHGTEKDISALLLSILSNTLQCLRDECESDGWSDMSTLSMHTNCLDSVSRLVEGKWPSLLSSTDNLNKLEDHISVCFGDLLGSCVSSDLAFLLMRILESLSRIKAMTSKIICTLDECSQELLLNFPLVGMVISCFLLPHHHADRQVELVQRLFKSVFDNARSGIVKIFVDCLLFCVRKRNRFRDSLCTSAIEVIVESLTMLCSTSGGKDYWYSIAVMVSALDRSPGIPKCSLLKEKCFALLLQEIEKNRSLADGDKRLDVSHEKELGLSCIIEWILWAPSLVEELQLSSSSNLGTPKRAFDYVVALIDEWRSRKTWPRRKRRLSQSSDDLNKPTRSSTSSHVLQISQEVSSNLFREWLSECGNEHWQLVEVAMTSINSGSALCCYREADIVELTRNYLNVFWIWPPWGKKIHCKNKTDASSNNSPERHGRRRRRSRGAWYSASGKDDIGALGASIEDLQADTIIDAGDDHLGMMAGVPSRETRSPVEKRFAVTLFEGIQACLSEIERRGQSSTDIFKNIFCPRYRYQVEWQELERIDWALSEEEFVFITNTVLQSSLHKGIADNDRSCTLDTQGDLEAMLVLSLAWELNEGTMTDIIKPLCQSLRLLFRYGSVSQHPDKVNLASLSSRILCKCVKEFCLKPGQTSIAILRVALASLSNRMEKSLVTKSGLQIVRLVRSISSKSFHLNPFSRVISTSFEGQMASSKDYQIELGVCVRWLRKHLQELDEIDTGSLGDLCDLLRCLASAAADGDFLEPDGQNRAASKSSAANDADFVPGILVKSELQCCLYAIQLSASYCRQRKQCLNDCENRLDECTSPDKEFDFSMFSAMVTDMSSLCQNLQFGGEIAKIVVGLLQRPEIVPKLSVRLIQISQAALQAFGNLSTQCRNQIGRISSKWDAQFGQEKEASDCESNRLRDGNEDVLQKMQKFRSEVKELGVVSVPIDIIDLLVGEENGDSSTSDESWHEGAKHKKRRKRRRQSAGISSNAFINAILAEEGHKNHSREDYADLEDFIVCRPGRDYRKFMLKKSLTRASSIAAERP